MNASHPSPRSLRVLSLCGSIKPLFSGTDDYHETLVRMLAARGLRIELPDSGEWGISRLSQRLEEVRRIRPDAILMQYPTETFGRGLLPHALAMVQRHAPLIVTLHEFVSAHPLRRASLVALLARASAVITTAEDQAASICRWYPWLRSRVRIIPLAPTTPQRTWRPLPQRSVVYFGQVRPDKGLEEFLAIRKRLADALPDVAFTVIGSRVPLFADYYGKFAADACQLGVEVTGALDAEAVADRLSEAWVALLPFPDGVSMRRSSLLSAAVCGTPIATQAGPATPDWLIDLLALLRPVADLTDLVQQLLCDPLARAAAHARSCRLGKQVDWQAVTDCYVAVIRDVASVSPRHAYAI